MNSSTVFYLRSIKEPPSRVMSSVPLRKLIDWNFDESVRVGTIVQLIYLLANLISSPFWDCDDPEPIVDPTKSDASS